MATFVKQFSFNTDAEGWTFNAGGGTGLTGARDTTDDSTSDPNAGNGALQTRRAGKNLTDGSPYWSWTGTFFDLGLPAGADLDSVNVDYDWRCSEYTTGVTSVVGPATEYLDGVIQANWSEAATFAATSAWTTRLGVADALGPTTTDQSLEIRITTNPKTGSSSSAAVTLRIEWVVVAVTYIEVPFVVMAPPRAT